MNYNDVYAPTRTKSSENVNFDDNGNLTAFNLPGIRSKVGQSSENQLRLRVQELENYNSLLEKLVEHRSNKLTEVVATNTKFVSILAHDLRSPFSTILGVLEILKESLNDFKKSEVENYVNIASNSANRTLKLLDNLLTWTISQNKEKSYNPVKINLSESVNEELDNIKISADQKQISLHCSVAPDLNVSGDIQMVKTILRNLISNAIKYTHSGGEINLTAYKNRDLIEIVISDSGVGITKEAQKNLFKTDAFQSTTGTNNEKGTGLGLIICKEFVETLGGKIWVESDPDNRDEKKGSRFYFSLLPF